MEWFRLYAEFATDPKVQMMSEAMQRRLVVLMCIQCGNNIETFHETDRETLLGFALRLPAPEMTLTKAEFMRLGFIDKNWLLVNWSTRQYASDSSTERVRKHRSRMNGSVEVSKKGDETLRKRSSNAVEQNRTEHIQKHQGQKPLSAKSEKVKPEPPENPKPLVKYGHRLPSDWQPTDELLTWVKTDHPMVDLSTERAKFVDYWQAKSGKDATKLDWDATFRNWIRNAKPGINHGNNQSGRRESTSERASRFAREGDQREAARDAATSSAISDAKVLGEDGGNLRLPLDV